MIQEIIDALWSRLLDIAKDLIGKTQDLSQERNRRFFEHPDDPQEHAPEWHQWGILTHTKMFEKFYKEELLGYLIQWNVHEYVDRHLSEKIDGMNKKHLLLIAILLHDLGKFTTRRLIPTSDGSFKTSFRDHEAASGQIIRTPAFAQMLEQEYGLSVLQIAYIARAAELHYELGELRYAARHSPQGYTIAFAHSQMFHNSAKRLMEKEYEGFEAEIGLLFLGDSLAKTDIRLLAKTDEEIAASEQLIQELLEKRKLNPKLINAVKQLPVNLAIAEAYLHMWIEKDSA